MAHLKETVTINRELEDYIQSHPIHAPDIGFNLADVVGELRPLPGDRDRAGVALVKEHGLNIVLTVMKPNCTISKHVSRGPISIQVIDGAVTLDAHGHTRSLARGDMAIVDAHVEHGIVADTDSAILMTIPSGSN